MTRHLAEARKGPLAFVVGEAIVDLVIAPTGRARYVGGSPVNVACALTRLEMPTFLRTQIGNDENGRFIRDHLLAEGVNLDPASIGPESTSTALARIQPDGHAEYVFNVAWGSGRFQSPSGVSFVHTGSIASALAPGAADVVDLVARAPEGVVHSFDPNIRASVLVGKTEVRATTDAIAMFSQIVKLSDEDAEWLYPGVDLDGVIDRYLELGASIVAITRGADGCVVASSTARVRHPAVPLNVVDTIGAGDAFMAGILFAVHAMSMKRRLFRQELAESDLATMALIASESAGIAVSRPGSQPPTLAELMERVGEAMGAAEEAARRLET